MAPFKTKANIANNGSLTVVVLPFKPDAQVEVTIEPVEEAQEEKDRYRYEASATSTTVHLMVWRLTIGGSRNDFAGC